MAINYLLPPVPVWTKIFYIVFKTFFIIFYSYLPHLYSIVYHISTDKINMTQVQPETLPKNSNCSSCLQNIKLKITPPKTPNSEQFSYPLPNIVSFLFETKSTRVPV